MLPFCSPQKSPGGNSDHVCIKGEQGLFVRGTKTYVGVISFLDLIVRRSNVTVVLRTPVRIGGQPWRLRFLG